MHNCPPNTRFIRFCDALCRGWVLISVLVLVALSMKFLDLPLAERLHSLELPLSIPWLQPMTNLALSGAYLVLLAVMALSAQWVFHRAHLASRMWFLWGCVALPNAFCLVLKITLGRARPELWFTEHLYGFYGPHRASLYWSFPSGHTSTIMGFVLGLSALFPRHCIAFIGTGLLIASVRILLVQHYLSDVVFATALSLMSVRWLLQWAPNYLEKRIG